jgi:hypothetical protein
MVIANLRNINILFDSFFKAITEIGNICFFVEKTSELITI